MTLFRLKDILNGYLDNVEYKPQLRNVVIKVNNKSYDIDEVTEDSKGDIVLKVVNTNYLNTFINYIRSEFSWGISRKMVWANSITRKIL